MSETPWVRFFPSDWLAGTRGMSASETGIYITLIAEMYERLEPLREDTGRLARLCGATKTAFKNTLETLIVEGKIQRTDKGIWNERVEKEIAIREEKSRAARESSKSRWSKKDNKNNGGDDANAMRETCGGDANQNQSIDPQPPLQGDEDIFENGVWQSYPTGVNDTLSKAQSEFNKLDDEQKRRCVASVSPYATQVKAEQGKNGGSVKIKTLARWIRERGWEGFEASSSAPTQHRVDQTADAELWREIEVLKGAPLPVSNNGWMVDISIVEKAQRNLRKRSNAA